MTQIMAGQAQTCYAMRTGYVSREMCMSTHLPQPAHDHDFATLAAELRAFAATQGKPDTMPMLRELRAAGRADLVWALQRQGGSHAVALRLGLATVRKSYGYWQDPAALERELRAFIAEHGEDGVMPSRAKLEAAGRGDLVTAMARSGGATAVAARLGLRLAKNPHGYWQNWANVEAEVRAFVEAQGQPGVMPTTAELLAARRFDLYYGISRNGGWRAVAERLGLMVRDTAAHRKKTQRR